MNKFKRAKASERENGVDMISNLPDPILQLILLGIPHTEEVIRTSILSKRWRYLWTLIPSLDIHCYRGPNSSILEFRKKKFKEFVYWVLLNKTIDMESFRLCCASYYNMSTVGRWIHVAVMRKVKLLELTFSPKEDHRVIELPHCLVTCESLEVLKLCLLTHPLRLPNFIGFPSLKVLELDAVNLFDDDLVQEFFKNCTLLEDLSFKDCVINDLEALCISCPKLKTLRFVNRTIGHYIERGVCGVFMISCPKLVFFELGVPMAYQFVFENLDSLKKAVIHAEYTKHKTFSFELINGVYHVESLSLNLYFIQFYQECIDDARDLDEDFSVCLPNLKTLELLTTTDAFTMKLLIWILICCPNLESPHLFIQKEFATQEHWKLDEFETRRILTPCLKRVEFLEFNGERPKLDVARLLLEHGHALEEMVFCWVNKAKYHEMSMMRMNQVSKFYKASSIVKLTTLLKEDRG